MRTRVLAKRTKKTHLGGYPMSAVNNNQAINPTFFETVSNSAKNFAANAGDFLSRVWESVKGFFTDTLPQWFAVAKDALVAAKDHIVNLPTNVKVAGGVAAAVVAVGAFLVGKCYGATPVVTASVSTSVSTSVSATAPVSTPVNTTEVK